jgi:phage gpG-like protein
MPVRVNNKSNLDLLARDLREIPSRVLQRRLPNLEEGIVNRAKSGRDNRGNTYPSYSLSYENFKRSIGQTGEPNLTLTGSMLNSLATSVERSGGRLTGTIRVTGSFNQDKARWNQGENSNIPERPFMFLPPEDIESLIREMYQFLE